MMEAFYDFEGFLVDWILRGIFISVLVLIVVQHTLKRIDLYYARIILKWIMISFACLGVVNLASGLIEDFMLTPDPFAGVVFQQRAFGEYWFSFWLMMVGSTVIPFVLLISRIGNSLGFMLAVALLMNIGWLFERSVIIITSLYRDYEPEGWFVQILLFLHPLNIYFFRGLLLGITVLIVGQVIARAQRNKQPIE